MVKFIDLHSIPALLGAIKTTHGFYPLTVNPVEIGNLTTFLSIAFLIFMLLNATIHILGTFIWDRL